MSGVTEGESQNVSGSTMLWLPVPTVVVAIAMLHWQNGWWAMLAFHGTMIVALIVHRRQVPWKILFRRAVDMPLLWSHRCDCGCCSAVQRRPVPDRESTSAGYGAQFDALLHSHALPEATRFWFALQLCLLNPVLEEGVLARSVFCRQQATGAHRHLLRCVSLFRPDAVRADAGATNRRQGRSDMVLRIRSHGSLWLIGTPGDSGRGGDS